MEDLVLNAAKSGGRDFELVPQGTYAARVYRIVNLGHVPYEWNGEKKDAHKIRIYWEIPEKTISYEVEKDGVKTLVEKPMSISRKLTLSMGEKSNLRPLVVGMIGLSLSEEEAYAFNIYSLLDHACLISIIHEKSKDGTREYAIVNSASTLPSGMKEPEKITPSEAWDVTKMTQDEILKLPDYIKKDMEASTEYHLRFLAPRGGATSLDQPVDYPSENIRPEDIPF